MGTGLEVLAYAGLAASAVGTAVSYTAQQNQADQADEMANYQRQQAAADASYAAGEAQVQARMIRKAADKQRAEARAALSGSGVTVGVGTAEQIDGEINADAEQDALMSIYDGNNRASQIRAGGNINAMRSENAASAARWNAAGTALSGVASAASGWNTASAKKKA